MQTLAAPTLTLDAPVILTKAGLPKRRWYQDEKLELLDPRSCRSATLSRLQDYQRLFAYKATEGIVTRRGQGPSVWTACRHPIGDNEIINHLLADRFPGRTPVWFGTRSYNTSLYLCLDVDADRTPEQILVDEYSVKMMDGDDKDFVLRQIRRRKVRSPFLDRCTQVEQAFRRMGINPDNPLSVLILQTPSGGRHYYTFFDAPYSLDQYHGILHEAGLRHVPGEIEFYPSTKQGLRLPFGHLPGQPHDPNAWIQFIDDYRNGRILRHSLATVYDSLAKHRAVQSRRIRSIKSNHPSQTPSVQKPIMGIPRHALPETTATTPTNATTPAGSPAEERYKQLLDGLHSFADAEELMDLGILLPGTRTQVLMLLAAHLIWFKHLPAADAALILTDWAMSPRHNSKDIAADLAKGTTLVAKHIQIICRWHEAHKETTPPEHENKLPEFFTSELDTLRTSLAKLPPDDRINQAQFLLHFLRFAKRHGTATDNPSGWNVAVHINKVIKRWPGCSHMKYKERIDHATATGILTKTKGPWHHANGPGRATTYRLSIPVVPEIQWVLTYEAALEFLTGTDPAVSTENQPGQ